MASILLRLHVANQRTLLDRDIRVTARYNINIDTALIQPVDPRVLYQYFKYSSIAGMTVARMKLSKPHSLFEMTVLELTTRSG